MTSGLRVYRGWAECTLAVPSTSSTETVVPEANLGEFDLRDLEPTSVEMKCL